ncbi:MAG: TIGR03643 family protein [Holosporales bacterium]
MKKISAPEQPPYFITSEVIAMAWDDQTSFEAIHVSSGLSEQQVIALMRQHLKPGSFRTWRKRVSGRSAKHSKRTRGAPCLEDLDDDGA